MIEETKFDIFVRGAIIVLSTIVKVAFILAMIIWSLVLIVFTGSFRGLARANGRTAGGQ